jgi:hypothetical protein
MTQSKKTKPILQIGMARLIPRYAYEKPLSDYLTEVNGNPCDLKALNQNICEEIYNIQQCEL